jgi:hypothetical protein
MIRIKNPTPARLPSEYQELDYIASTGTQWIDTGYTPVQNDELEIKNVICPIKSSYQAIFSAGTGTYQWILLIANSSDSHGAYYKYFKGGEAYFVLEYLTTTTTIKSNSSGLYYNNNKVGSSSYVGGANTTLRLLQRANNSSGATAQIGEVTIKNGDTIKRNMIPCYRKSDNEPGMYDLVNGTFYTNAGSGTFLMGNEVGKRDLNINPAIFNLPMARGYINGKLFYGKEPAKEVAFTENIAPTSWTSVSNNKYTATNEYGEWIISSSGYKGSACKVNSAFDDLDSTYWWSNELSSNSAEAYIQLDCPVLIKPSGARVKSKQVSNGKVQGYNPSTESWETLETFETNSVITADELTLNSDTYYSKFRVSCNRQSSSNTQVFIYDFKIVAGTYKI